MCQCLVTITLTGTWESRGNNSLFQNEEQFVFNNNDKIPVITVKRLRKVMHSQVDEIFLLSLDVFLKILCSKLLNLMLLTCTKWKVVSHSGGDSNLKFDVLSYDYHKSKGA